MNSLARRGIEVRREALEAFCQRHCIRKLSLFGSILRDDFGRESDVDFLVEFEAGKTPGLLELIGMELELSELVGRSVDLRTVQDLSRYFRDRVLREAEVQYVA
jgi:predicted nucleotidyltransferase